MNMTTDGLQRTSLYDISWQVTEQEYRKGEGISYSTMSRFNREGFDGLHKLFEPIEGAHLVFGSMVDTLLTGTKQEFEETFVIAEFPHVVDSQLGMVKYLFNNHAEDFKSLAEIPDKKIIEASEVLAFQSYWKPATRAKVIKENCAEYYNLLHISRGKQLIGTKEYEDAKECVDALKTSYYTKFYFEKNNPFDTSIERFFQLKFKGEYNGIPLRCMADEIMVNHKTKTVTPIDLKTSYKKEWNFHQSFMQWGYWIQAQLYWYIIRQNMDKHPLYKDYVLEDYKFIIVSNNSRIPLTWTYTDTQKEEDMYYGKNNQHFCRNWRGIVVELNHYLTKKPTVPIGIKESNDIITWLNIN